MSHHYAGPNFGFPHGDARLNLTDLYAFPKPGSDGKSILIIRRTSVPHLRSASANHAGALCT
jgi:hypothetical protein